MAGQMAQWTSTAINLMHAEAQTILVTLNVGRGQERCTPILLWSFFGVFRISELLASAGARRGLRLQDVSFVSHRAKVAAQTRTPVTVADPLALFHRGAWQVVLVAAKSALKAMARVCKIGPVTSHSARIGAASCAVAAGLPLDAVRAAGG